MNTMELLDRCIRNAKVGYDKEFANRNTDSILANSMKYVFGRLTDNKFTKTEKIRTITKYLNDLTPTTCTSLTDYNIMHARMCAIIQKLVDMGMCNTANPDIVACLCIVSSMYELNLRRDAIEQGLIQLDMTNATIKSINYLIRAFDLMYNSIGMYEDVIF